MTSSSTRKAIITVTWLTSHFIGLQHICSVTTQQVEIRWFCKKTI